MTSFVGRRQAKADLKRALGTSRLVTLTGPGGVGKTRLALQTAHELRRVFPDGVWLTELVRLRDPALVPQAVAAALDLRDQSTRAPETVLTEYLGTRHLLLVLDNCEHVLDACSRLVHTLLAATPDLRVLATSRESLRIQAECVWPVPPLTVPATDGDLRDGSGLRYEALVLFEDRVNAVLPGFRVASDNEAAVVQLCRRLDGVPLAIELAAVRARALSVDQILGRLEDRFRLLTAGNRAALPRHQTLRAAVDWSFQLCDEQERLLWARCSVFAGEFDLDAAESVCGGDGLSPGNVLNGIADLVDKSILTRSPGTKAGARYQMLETIRAYGRERLAEAGEDNALRRRHRDYYLHLSEQSDADSWGPRQPQWARRLSGERANIWAALDYCLTTPGEARAGLRMAGALWFCWMGCGHAREGRHWLGRALTLDTAPSRERARALWVAGWIAVAQGDNTPSQVMLRESRDLARQLGDEDDLAYATQLLGDAESFVGNVSHAAALLDEAIARHRAARAWTVTSVLALVPRARVAFELGDTGQALALLTEGQDICRSTGEHWASSWLEFNIGAIVALTGDARAAEVHLREALRKKDDLHDLLGIPFCLDLLASTAANSDDAYRAALLLGAAERLWEQVYSPLFNYGAMLGLRAQAQERARDALGAQEFDAARRRGLLMSDTDVIAYALGDEPAPYTPGPRATRLPVQAAEPTLTKREREVAELAATGMSNKEIAARLVISRRTAEAHIEHILVKLGFTSRTQIAAWLTPSD